MRPTLLFHLINLRSLGADRIRHKNGTLLQHLQGTWSLLSDWGNSHEICMAGLYHSVYGTGGFEGQLLSLDRRSYISELIGHEAEQLVYLFAACNRPATHPRIGKQKPLLFSDRFIEEEYSLEENQWKAQCEIMIANEIDLGLHNPNFYRKHLDHYTDLFGRFTPWLSESALTAHEELARTVARAID